MPRCLGNNGPGCLSRTVSAFVRIGRRGAGMDASLAPPPGRCRAVREPPRMAGLGPRGHQTGGPATWCAFAWGGRGRGHLFCGALPPKEELQVREGSFWYLIFLCCRQEVEKHNVIFFLPGLILKYNLLQNFYLFSHRSGHTHRLFSDNLGPAEHAFNFRINLKFWDEGWKLIFIEWPARTRRFHTFTPVVLSEHKYLFKWLLLLQMKPLSALKPEPMGLV